MHRKLQKVLKKIAIQVAVAAFWLLVWYIIYRLINKPLFLESPGHAFQALLKMLPKTEFWLSILYSLGRILLGLLIGSLCGVVLSFVTCYSKIAYTVFRPILVLTKTVPVVSFIMLLWLAFFGKEGAMSVVISALMVFPILWSQMSTGHQTLDPKLLEMAKVYSNPKDTLLYIKLPHLFPYFRSGLSTAAGLAWKAGIAAEVICNPSHSIGSGIYEAKHNIDSADLLAWTIVVVLLSLFTENVLVRLLRKIRFRVQIKSSSKVKGNGPSQALLFDHINKHYGEKHVLKNFTYTFRNGKTFAIMGTSGCGKTTLLSIAAGMQSDDEKRYEKPRNRPGVIFQENRLIPTLTVRENLLFVNRGANIKGILKAVGLSEEADHYPEQLSGGMQRRVAIGRAIAFGGCVGIFDEPFTGLDDSTKALCAQALFKAYNDKTVLFVTHDREDAERYAETVLTMEEKNGASF